MIGNGGRVNISGGMFKNDDDFDDFFNGWEDFQPKPTSNKQTTKGLFDDEADLDDFQSKPITTSQAMKDLFDDDHDYDGFQPKQIPAKQTSVRLTGNEDDLEVFQSRPTSKNVGEYDHGGISYHNFPPNRLEAMKKATENLFDQDWYPYDKLGYPFPPIGLKATKKTTENLFDEDEYEYDYDEFGHRIYHSKRPKGTIKTTENQLDQDWYPYDKLGYPFPPIGLKATKKTTENLFANIEHDDKFGYRNFPLNGLKGTINTTENLFDIKNEDDHSLFNSEQTVNEWLVNATKINDAQRAEVEAKFKKGLFDDWVE